MPRTLIPSGIGLLNLREPDDPLGVDQEGAPPGDTGDIVEHPVGRRHLALRPEVGHQRERILLPLRPFVENERGIDRDAEDLDVVVAVNLDLVPDPTELGAADRGERARLVDQENVRLSREDDNVTGFFLLSSKVKSGAGEPTSSGMTYLPPMGD